MAQYTYSIRDNSDEYGRLTIPVQEPTEVGMNWETIINTNEATFRAALDAMILGNIASHHVLVSGELVNDARPASPWAQREYALRVFVTGANTGEKRNFTIPTIDLDSVELVAGTDLADLTAEPMATFVTAVESNYRIIAADGGEEAVTVERAVVVGRNS